MWRRAEKKAELPVSHMLILGFFAGMFIALAGAGASVASAAMTNASASRIAFGTRIPGRIGAGGLHRGGTFHWELPDDDLGAQKRISVGGLFKKSSVLFYLGNLIGAIFVAVLFVYGHIPSLYGGDLAAGSSEYSRFQGDPDFAGGAVPCDPL